MNTAAMWAGVVGFLSPLVIQFIQQESWSRKVQSLVAFVFCLLVAIPTAYFSHPGELTTADYVKDVVVVFTVAIASYKGLWNPSNVTPTNHAEATGRG